MPLSTLQQMQLNAYRRELGVMTSEEALAAALAAEVEAKTQGRLNPVVSRIIRRGNYLLAYAELLEKEEQQ